MHSIGRYIVFQFLFLGVLFQELQAQTKGYDTEYKKLVHFVSKIMMEDGVRERVFNKASTLLMLAFHLNEKQQIDSISIQCSDSAITISVKKVIVSDRLSVSWQDFILTGKEGELCKSTNTFYFPVFLINESNNSNKVLFSKDDIESIFFKDFFTGETVSYSLQCAALIKPLEMKISTHEPVR